MATAYRTTQTSEWVHLSDSDAKPLPAGARTAHEEWLPASTQPAGCTRFTVRPLSSDEWSALFDADEPEGRNAHACRLALVAVDGQAPDLAVFSPAFKASTAALIASLTLSGPLGGRRSE